MAQIIRGTTPTLQYTFNTVTVANIAAAYLTIKQNNQILLQKDLTAATVGAKTLSWTLTQQDTLTIAAGQMSVMLNWKLQDGTRGASETSIVMVSSNHIEEVI